MEKLQMSLKELKKMLIEDGYNDSNIVLQTLINIQKVAINYTHCCEQLTVKEWEIDFGGDVLAGLEITNNEPKIIGARNGWGNGIDKEAITITQK